MRSVYVGDGWERGGSAERMLLRFGMTLACTGAALAVLPGAALATLYLWVSGSGTDAGFCSQG